MAELKYYDNGWQSLIKGSQGLSAYQVALANGFIGSELDWINSISHTPLIYTFSSPLPSWIINHNLNYYPQVTVMDLQDKEVLAEVNHNSTTQVQINFSKPQIGKVVLH